MLGDKLGRASGKVVAQRVLREGTTGIKLETTIDTHGKLLGVDIHERGTYFAVMRPDGTLYGEGQGLITGKSGEMTTWLASGVGTMRKDGGVNFRGAVYYQTNTPKWLRLNSVAAVYEYSADAKGRTKADIWEWK